MYIMPVPSQVVLIAEWCTLPHYAVPDFKSNMRPSITQRKDPQEFRDYLTKMLQQGLLEEEHIATIKRWISDSEDFRKNYEKEYETDSDNLESVLKRALRTIKDRKCSNQPKPVSPVLYQL